MTFEEIDAKYGPAPDWEKVDPYDFYHLLNDSRAMWEALAEEGLLSSHPIYAAVRKRTVTDIFFLNLFLWDANPYGGPDEPIESNLMTLENHEKIIEMFVVKDPTKSIANQTDIKNRMILYPRGTLKSSWGIIDVIQWVLLDASVRILVLTAADDLAEAIVDEIKGYFVIKEKVPSLMNLFWPEHCELDKNLKGAGEFTTPAWTVKQIKRREPTVMAKSVTSTISGFHFDCLHMDDAISDRNSNNDEQCESVKKRYGLTRKTLRTFGYTTLIGTRYHEADLYGHLISLNEANDFTSTEFNICSKRIDNKGTGTIILIGAAMTIKPDAAKEMAQFGIEKKLWFRKAGRDGVEILMPKVLTYDSLLPEFERDPEAFETQMRQNVTGGEGSVFTDELLLKAVIPWTNLPTFGRITHTWDLNGGKGKKDNDFCVGTSCLWDDKGVGIIMDLVRANYPTPLAIAAGIVQFTRKHHPEAISIEDSPGARMLEPTICAEADKTDDPYVKAIVRRIYWRPVDNSKDAKKHRINSVQPLLMYGRLKFVDYLPFMEPLKKEFKRKITVSSKNDIPDAISFQTYFMPSMTSSSLQQDITKKEEDKKKQIEAERSKKTWEMLFSENNDHYYQEPMREPQEYSNEEIFSSNSEPGLDNILGSGLIG